MLKYILIAIWCVGAIWMYRHHAKLLEDLKDKNKDDTSPLLYDVIYVLVIIFWPLMIPGTIMKIVGLVKEKKKDD